MTYLLTRDHLFTPPPVAPDLQTRPDASGTSGVAVDIDNTVADTMSGLRAVLAYRLNLHPGVLIATDSYARPLVPSLPTCEAELSRAYDDIWFDPALDVMAPVPGAAALLWELTRAGAFAGYVTRRPARQARSTLAWLSRHGFPLQPVVHAQACKSDGMRALNAGVLIDDHADEVESVTRAGLIAVLLSQPYNAGCAVPALACRAATLPEAVGHAVGALGALRATRRAQ